MYNYHFIHNILYSNNTTILIPVKLEGIELKIGTDLIHNGQQYIVGKVDIIWYKAYFIKKRKFTKDKYELWGSALL